MDLPETISIGKLLIIAGSWGIIMYISGLLSATAYYEKQKKQRRPK